MRVVGAATRPSGGYAREPIVEVRERLSLDTERWTRNTGMHDFANQPTKELTKGGDFLCMSSHSCVLTHHWALKQTPYSITGIRLL
jgi:hypothetical protein